MFEIPNLPIHLRYFINEWLKTKKAEHDEQEDAVLTEAELQQQALNECLFIAALADNPNGINILIDAGANVKAKRPCGKTPLDLACKHKKRKAIRALLQADPATVHALTAAGLARVRAQRHATKQRQTPPSPKSVLLDPAKGTGSNDGFRMPTHP